jgi:hypothetical protein
MTYSLGTKLLSNQIGQLVSSPDNKSIASLAINNTTNPIIISNFDGSKPSAVWSSPISDWLVSWPTAKNLILTTKPSVDIPGYSYLLNIATKNYTRIIGDINGLTILASPNLSTILYSESDSNANPLSLTAYGVKSASTQALPIKTLPEKCVWSSIKTSIFYCAVPDNLPNASYPDDWYKGVISFSDSIWRIDLATGESKYLANLSQMSGQSIDATRLALDSREDYLTFINKRDLTLWGLQIATTTPASTSSSATSTKKK